MFYLIDEKFTEVLNIQPALGSIHHCNCAVDCYLASHVHILYRLHHIGKLAHTGRLNQDPFRMIRIHNLLQGCPKIAYQRTADASGIHLLDFNTGFLQETAVNADFAKFVFNQYYLASCQGFLQKLLN